MAKHLVHSTETQHIDEETGQLIITTTEKVHTVKVDEDAFFMTYLTLLKPIYQLEHLADIKLIVKLCEMAEFNTGKVSITSGKRKELCEELSISTSNFSKYTKRLKDKGLITGQGGDFTINPAVFWKGDRKSRAAMLKQGLTVTINFKSDDEK